MKLYRTVRAQGHGTYEEKRSRFVAAAGAVETEADALAFIERIRVQGRDASHHCYAYSIDGKVEIRRASDDGEPSGTAGVPILEVLNKQHLTNTVVVVSRWFGGTLLGASGLIRAYGKAAGLSILDAGVMVVKPLLEMCVQVDYELSGRVANHIASAGLLPGGTEYAGDVRYRLYVEPGKREAIERVMMDLTAARAVVHSGEMQAVAFTEEDQFIRLISGRHT